MKKIAGYSWREIFWTALGSFAGIAVVAFLTTRFRIPLLVPSFGASAVLLYAACHVPMAQPRNVIGGHFISALMGVGISYLTGLSWWSLALGVTFAIIGMMLTGTLHPPGGATAFVANGYKDWSDAQKTTNYELRTMNYEPTPERG
ncbi:MAG: HPP family protein [Clostridia bacterium]|nr:HPP family protein [Clostridia bacterium]